MIVKDLLKVEQLWYMDDMGGIITQHVNIHIMLIYFDQIQIKLNNKIFNVLIEGIICAKVFSQEIPIEKLVLGINGCSIVAANNI